MKILGFDTSSKVLCFGIYDGAKIYTYDLKVGNKLSFLLSTTIKRVLDALGWEFSEIDYFACGLGPGSFTGLRVGLAAIKGFSFALNRPIVGVSSLDILARNIQKEASGPIVPAIDAKRNLIYCSFYKNKGGAQKRTAPYMLLTPEKFLAKVEPNSIVFGDAVSLYKEKIIGRIKGVTILDKDYWYPRAHNLITLAIEKIKEKKISNSFKVKPIYLYPKECQIKQDK